MKLSEQIQQSGSSARGVVEAAFVLLLALEQLPQDERGKMLLVIFEELRDRLLLRSGNTHN